MHEQDAHHVTQRYPTAGERKEYLLPYCVKRIMSHVPGNHRDRDENEAQKVEI